MEKIIYGKPLIAGTAEGPVLYSSEPLSFWGGYDHKTGEITDRRHPLSGMIAAEKVLLLPFTRGSSTTTAVLLEAIRAGTAPSAILTESIDSFLALASVVAAKLYGEPLPIVQVSADDFKVLSSARRIRLDEEGKITFLGD